MTAETQTPAISPKEIDSYCRDYAAREREIELLSADLVIKKAALVTLVQTHGYVPTNAEKSRRLDGIEMVATTTTGSSVEVKSDSVTHLQLRLSQCKKPRLFKLLFSRTIKYSLVKDASDALKVGIAGLPEKVRTELLTLFASCFDVNSKTPSLSVDAVSVIKAKEEKAAKKAAKKGGAK